MDCVGQSSKWSLKRQLRADISILCMFVSIACLTQIVNCQKENISNESPKVSRLTVEYKDNSGYKHINDDFERGNYANNARVNSSPIKGRLVLVQTLYNNSELGCTRINPDIVPKNEPWVALIKRGECTFSEKIYNAAKNSSASAVIIMNLEGSVLIHADDTRKTHLTMTTVTEGGHNVQDIVAILISFEKGKKLVDMLKSHNVNITITHMPKKDDPPDSPGQLNNTSVLFVSISFIVLIIISLAWLVFYYIQRCRYTNAKERLSRRLANAAKKAIAKIPQRTIKAGDKELEAEADQCAVCIEPYKWNDVIRVLPCKHVFHKSCVDPWLLDQRNCPMCKMDILRAFGMHLNDSQESVPQDAESGLMSSTGAADDTEHLSNSEEPGAVGGVKIVLYQHPVRYCDGGSSQFQESVYSSDGSLDLQSSPVAQCHVECAGRAIVEHNRNSELSPEEEPCLARSGSIDSVHSFDDDLNLLESQSLMTRKSSREGASVTSMGSKSLRRGSESSSISLSMKEKM
ncbi:RING finger protein 150-like isoform X1 [Ruditapes philippinarum]|uniref:RING finger protein 150-like isoform X1 n=2 Tax=Ruditapes philippinarum TaxID=129788 RepID=UPI00295B3480|nr:RING finger protein 150-like isoform X1 [Ruditapes philippinarum]